MQNQVRIIGGRFRARRLSFPNLPELRPSTDRLRVTLFNWLKSELYQTHCLDTFAGSGALGFEALSRGSAHCTFLDRSPEVTDALKINATKLSCAEDCSILTQDALAFLKTTNHTFDIIFLDPPFQGSLLTEALALIHARSLAKKYVYIETSEALENLPLADWQIAKQTKVSAVSAALLKLLSF